MAAKNCGIVQSYEATLVEEIPHECRLADLPGSDEIDNAGGVDGFVELRRQVPGENFVICIHITDCII